MKKLNTEYWKKLLETVAFSSGKISMYELVQKEHRHFHPSGNLEPSKEDIHLTDQLVQVGQLMGIPIVDHIITNQHHEYFSMNDRQMVQVKPISYENNLSNLSFGTGIAAENAVSMESPKIGTKKATDLQEIMNSLEDGVAELFTSERYTQYLNTMSKFHTYSFNNTLLIAMQRPDATYVAGYNKWKSMGRQVTKDQKAIKIIAPAPIKKKVLRDKQGIDGVNSTSQEKEEVEITIPRFKITNVFDISQTEGEPLPTLGVDELNGNVDQYDVFMKAIRKVSPVPIRFDEIEGGAHGYYHNVDKEIVIQKGMSELQTMKTAIHEVAHAKLHDRDMMEAQGIKKDALTKEVEAESVAYAVCQSFELDTSDYSFAYIAGWSSGKDMKELKASMDVIRTTAGGFIDEMSEEIKALTVMQESIPKDTIEKLAADIDQFSFDYDTYGYQDTVDDRESAVKEIQNKLANGNIEYLKKWLEDIQSSADEVGEYNADQAKGLLSRMQYLMPDEFQNTVKNTEQDYVKYYVAECMEFPVMGEYHEDLSFEEAVKAYENIPKERLHGVKGIGIQLHHNGEVEETGILIGTRVEREWIAVMPYMKNHPLVQKAVDHVESFAKELKAKERKLLEAKEDKPIKLKQADKPKRRGGQEL